MKDSLRVKGIFLVMLGTLLWGISGVVAQYLFQSKNFAPEWLVVIRMIFSGAIILTFSLLKGDKSVFEIWSKKENIIKILIFSILGMLGVQYSYFAAIHHGNAATATILQYLSPVIITIYLAFYNKKLPTLKQVACVFMAILGTFLIITKGNLNSLAISKPAIFWGVLSAFACAIYTLQPSSLLKKYGSLCVVGWGMLIGGVVFSFVQSPFNCVGNWSFESLLAIVFVVLFGTLIAFYCYLESLKYIEPYEASVFTCIEPLSASILSIVFLNVTFSLIQWIGTLCIIITISMLSLTKKGESSVDKEKNEDITN